ncbi:hypothetical protein J5277_00705 [Rhizobium sp. 16-449-1b]|uniref:hypothetical protein n=1 Tax=Rhizobium sp. 16-449-1b TaxID=2819989 RepID=UPI001ADC41EC|nr:hypothetical protein [Rhizobium sp. 16-449-1b]MBO9192614.1 hypothetical protein [Rhizobium sp. 16-449-1b]
MNKIVRDHYPVANLPEDLREGLGDVATVRIVVEPEPSASDTTQNDDPLLRKGPIEAHELMALRERYLALGHPRVTEEEAVARIRELRDEWDY